MHSQNEVRDEHRLLQIVPFGPKKSTGVLVSATARACDLVNTDKRYIKDLISNVREVGLCHRRDHVRTIEKAAAFPNLNQRHAIWYHQGSHQRS
jgi:hypothetical protein